MMEILGVNRTHARRMSVNSSHKHATPSDEFFFLAVETRMRVTKRQPYRAKTGKFGAICCDRGPQGHERRTAASSNGIITAESRTREFCI
jgi:hypothetical protein